MILGVCRAFGSWTPSAHGARIMLCPPYVRGLRPEYRAGHSAKTHMDVIRTSIDVGMLYHMIIVASSCRICPLHELSWVVLISSMLMLMSIYFKFWLLISNQINRPKYLDTTALHLPRTCAGKMQLRRRGSSILSGCTTPFQPTSLIGRPDDMMEPIHQLQMIWWQSHATNRPFTLSAQM